MKKLTALSLALLLVLSPAATGALAMEQLHPPAEAEEGTIVSPEEPKNDLQPVQPEQPEEELPPVQTEQPEEVPPTQLEEPEKEVPPTQTEEENPPVQAEEELPQSPVWTEVSTIEELCAVGGSAGHIRLTADLTVSAPGFQFYTFWTPTTLDMNGHHIRVASGGNLTFGGGATPVVILGDGGEEGAFRVLPGGRLDLGDVDASQLTGLLVRQAEGGWLVAEDVTAGPGQISYAQAPVVCRRVTGFAAVAQGLSPEELLEQLPDAKVFINYQGRYEQAVIPAEQLSWDLAEQWEDIEAGRRTVLHARPAGPITGESWFESELTPTVLAPIPCELAILVDGAAIGEINSIHDIYGSTYSLGILLPNQVQPEGLPLSRERGPACLEFSLDGGESWQSVSAGDKVLYTELLYADILEHRDAEPWETVASFGIFQMNTSVLVRVWADYQGEGYTFRLYTDTLTLSPEGAYVGAGSGGSRGGTVDLLPTPPDPPVTEPDPPEPVRPPVEDIDPPEPVRPPAEEIDPPEPVIPPVEETDPPEPVIPPVEETNPPEPVTPPVEETDPPEPVTPPAEGQEASDPPGESFERPNEPPDPAFYPAQTTPPDSQTQHTAAAPSPEKQTASALPSPTVQVLAGTAVTVTLVTAAAAAKPAAVLNWLRRLFHKL